MKASIYLRVSTEEQTEENQLAACQKFCEARGWQVIRIYRDRLSGYREGVERPDYEACKRDARAGEFKHVVVWSIDRWTRQGIDALVRDLEALSLWDVQLHSIQDSFLDESINYPGELGKAIRNFLIQLSAAYAKMESQKISDRVRAAYNRKREAGELADWGRPVIDLDPDVVKTKYVELRSLRKTAAHFQCSYQTVRRLLQNGHYQSGPEKPIESEATTRSPGV